MKPFHLRNVLLLALAGCFAMPVESDARDRGRQITVVRDRDGDGHFNKKTIDARHFDRGHFDGHDHGRYYGHDHGRYYGGGNRYGYYGGGYPYRGYGYGYGPSIGFTYSTAPSYSRAYDYDDDGGDLNVDAQRALRRRGYYNGPIDGDIGPGTRSAIRAYQIERGLPVSGRIDGPLIRSLGL